ncbi:heavy-metal-associated domain-containing protein [Furfurilactobacillus curtus]|uniref:Heavy metal-binding protein n=1 Tax=Furfurilactobacillus curtus TaxID=1746200 RepID=A0ABQ5JPC5_9LACO
MKMVVALDALTCPSCLTKIEKAVGRVTGVETVKVLFNASKVKVTTDSSVSEASLTEPIERLGYDVKGVKVSA